MIGYYVHHQGRGHLARAEAIAQALAEQHEPVTVLSSLPRPAVLTPFAEWIEVSRDDLETTAAGDGHGSTGASDHVMNDGLHWAPLGARSYRERMSQLSAWVVRARPAVVVVDVSVEVTLLCRLLGVPVVVVAGAGVRDDYAHQLGYRAATRIIAPWPGALYRPAHLHDHADRVCYVGAVSRFDRRSVPPPPHARRVLALFGAGGIDVDPASISAARAATGEWNWTVHGAGLGSWTSDAWQALIDADVVVTHAGMNSLAETAAARRPTVVLPQSRPFAEQRTTASVLARHGLAIVRPRWPQADEWSAALEAAVRLGGTGWQRWNDGGAAARAARSIAETGRGVARA